MTTSTSIETGALELASQQGFGVIRLPAIVNGAVLDSAALDPVTELERGAIYTRYPNDQDFAAIKANRLELRRELAGLSLRDV